MTPDADPQTREMLRTLSQLKEDSQSDVRDWARRFEETLVRRQSPEDAAPMGKRVLIVEDDRDMCGFLADCLRDSSYQPTMAFDGITGLGLARMLKPELVVVDLLLPGMHGFDLCETIRKAPELRACKILVSTAKRFEIDRRTAMRLGADAYLSKPYPVNAFLSSVRSLIGGPAK